MLQQLEQLEPIILGRSLKRKRENATHQHNWKKKSIFFQLPYWKTLLLRHNLDVMHIEKNVCDSIIGTLFNIEGKTKDNLNSHLDLKAMRIRKQLHPIKMGNKFILPTACYLLTVDEKKEFCKILKSIKVPDGYSSNISRCVQLNESKIYGLKLHDCHVLMQQLLPLAIRGVLHKNVCGAIIGLCNFFKQLCSKVLTTYQLQKIENDVVVNLCKPERIFPPSFFDIMMHLPVHLASEAKIAGPLQYRWMYPIERYYYDSIF